MLFFVYDNTDCSNTITFHNSAVLLLIDTKIADLHVSVSTQPQKCIAFQGQTEISLLFVSRCEMQAAKIRISINV